jgi:hypothetical protein
LLSLNFPSTLIVGFPGSATYSASIALTNLLKTQVLSKEAPLTINHASSKSCDESSQFGATGQTRYR